MGESQLYLGSSLVQTNLSLAMVRQRAVPMLGESASKRSCRPEPSVSVRASLVQSASSLAKVKEALRSLTLSVFATNKYCAKPKWQAHTRKWFTLREKYKDLTHHSLSVQFCPLKHQHFCVHASTYLSVANCVSFFIARKGSLP